MPSSRPSLIPRIIKVFRMIHNQEPLKRILDIGPGWGKYGLLLREYFDGESNMLPRVEWDLYLGCIEVEKKYTRPHLMYIYDIVWVENILDWSRKLKGKWDVILLLDLIQCMTKEDALFIITKLAERCKWILISTPTRWVYIPKESYHPLEQHITLYTEKDFPPQSLIWKDWSYVSLVRGHISTTIDYEKLIYNLRPQSSRVKK